MGRERYLLVSLGSIGRRHLRNLRSLRPAAEIGVLRQHSRVVDPTPPAGADVQFADLDAALAFAPRAAVVASPASTHMAIARRLAEAGVHVFLEKPMADCGTGLAELIRACERRELALMVGYNLRFLPSLRQVRAGIADGLIGRMLAVRAEVGQYLPDWRPGSDYRMGVSARAALGGGALLELSHELDYLYWLFGLPARVTARGGHYSDLELDVEDTAELILEYEAPAKLVNVHLDMVQRAPSRQCRFVGSEGTLIWDGISDEIRLFRAEAGEWRNLDGAKLLDRNQMYVDELEHFLTCVATGARPLIDGKAGHDVLTIVEAARRSMASGTTISVEAGGHG